MANNLNIYKQEAERRKREEEERLRRMDLGSESGEAEERNIRGDMAAQRPYNEKQQNARRRNYEEAEEARLRQMDLGSASGEAEERNIRGEMNQDYRRKQNAVLRNQYMKNRYGSNWQR